MSVLELPDAMTVEQARPFLDQGSIEVYLDGAKQENVIQYDRNAGFLTRYVTNRFGFVREGDEVKTETLTGRVEAVFTPRE